MNKKQCFYAIHVIKNNITKVTLRQYSTINLINTQNTFQKIGKNVN